MSPRAEKKKRRVVQKAKPETVRQQATKAQAEKPKKRRARAAVDRAKKPASKVTGFIKKIFKPFGFLLKPFKTRPVRAIGRFISKILLLNYFKESWMELRRVEWPSRKQTINLTTAVFIFAIGLTSVIYGADWILDRLFKELLLR